ncbi:glycosyltransferase, partial [Candidatus Parcubacteria bacterium]
MALVNSAHNEEKKLPAAWSALQIGSRTISEYLPPRWHRRPAGKILNLLGVKSDVDAVLARIPRPDVIWIYNAYAYEALFLRELLRRGTEGEKPRIVLEIEDWPLARLRKGHPKPWLDWAGLRYVLKRADAVFCVNEALASKVRRERPEVSVHVLPGLVDDAILKLHRESPPFQGDGPLRIGYFGGLSEEKGAGLLLEAIAASSDREWEWIVSGGGPMGAEFVENAKRYPRLRFYGMVSDEELVRLMGICDVIINPHRPISEMGDGVFPFKVVESVATGRLV